MSQQPFGDIPLFRELQRLLSSSTGPVNFEIASQIATAVATEGRPEAATGPEVGRSFADAVHEAETVLSGYTRLPLEEPLRSETIGRARWVSVTLDGWRWVLEHLAERFSVEMTRLGEGAEQGANPIQAAMGQMGPLLMGMQAGTLIGQLGREALGRFDFPVPRDDDGRLFFVAPNLDALAADYGLKPGAVRRWVAAGDVTRQLVMSSVPWASSYLRSLLTEVVDSLELDIQGLEQRLVEMQSGGMEAMEQGMEQAIGENAPIPIASTERHEKALQRVRAFLAVFEGYAAEAMRATGPQLVGEVDAARMSEAMTRAQATPSQGETALASLLGVALDRKLEQAGATFCRAVVEMKGLPALNRVWDAPDNLPSAEEVRDPFQWIERVLDSDGTVSS